MGNKKNLPNMQADSLSPEVVTKTMESLKEISNLPKIRRNPLYDQDFEDRVDLVIDFCMNKGVRLGIETLCAGLGVSRTELLNWENGEGVSERRQEGVKKIKQLIYAFLEQVGMSGRINPAAYIWLCKNWMGYSDTIKIETTAERSDVLSREEVKERYQQYKDMPDGPACPPIDLDDISIDFDE